MPFSKYRDLLGSARSSLFSTKSTYYNSATLFDGKHIRLHRATLTFIYSYDIHIYYLLQIINYVFKYSNISFRYHCFVLTPQILLLNAAYATSFTPSKNYSISITLLRLIRDSFKCPYGFTAIWYSAVTAIFWVYFARATPAKLHASLILISLWVIYFYFNTTSYSWLCITWSQCFNSHI